VTLRRPLTLVVGLNALGLGGLAIAYAGFEGPGLVDARIDETVRELFGPHRGALRRVVTLGSPHRIPMAAAALVVASLALRRPRVAVAGVAGLGLTALAVSVLQPAIGRTLGGGDALPSGHTAGAAAIAAAAALLLVSCTPRWSRTTACLAALGVLGVSGAVAVGLVVNGLHYTTDTIAGLCTAVAAVGVSALAVDAASDRSRDRTAPIRI
jgi:membrane-associated phospholipid phosphatase